VEEARVRGGKGEERTRTKIKIKALPAFESKESWWGFACCVCWGAAVCARLR
jgi:hypothetical protein